MKAKVQGTCCGLTAWARKAFKPRKQSLLAFLPTRCDDFEIWKKIVYAIDFDKIPAYAMSLRQKHGIIAGDGVKTRLTARIQKPALAGSFHIAFVIIFSDGMKWLLKVPATGYGKRFTKLEAQSLTSEVLTMQLLKRQTTIPIPEVYAYSNSSDNEIKCPFIMMEYIDGIPLNECWFNHKLSRELLEQHRATALNDIASAMLQMDKFTFSQSGAPVFSHNNALLSIGPAKVYDSHAMLAKLDRCSESKTGGDMSAAFCGMGPFSDFKSFMLYHLDLRKDPEAAKDPKAYKLGIDMLLRLFVDWLPSDYDSDYKPPFVLTHPDLGFQNVLVSEEGHLLSLIDWDGVSSVPRCLGNERYPSWLTRDWDPVAYAYSSEREADIALRKDEDDCPMPENSPEELRHYRAMYASIFAKLKSTPITNSTLTSVSSPDSQHDNTATKTTRHSLILDNLGIAISDETTTFYIVEKIYNEMVKLQTNGQVTDHETLFHTDDDDCDDDDQDEEPDAVTEDDSNVKGTGDTDGEDDTQNENKKDINIEEKVEETGSENPDSEFYWPKSLHYICSELAKGEKNEAVLRGVRDGFLMLFKETY